MQSCYKNQDAILKNFHVGLEQLNNLPFYRFQIMLSNLNEMVEQENKKNSQPAAPTAKLPNYNSMMRNAQHSLPKFK